MKASCHPRSSFVWKGFMAVQEVLLRGGIWRVGNGKDILISDDKWVRGMSNGKTLMNPVAQKVLDQVCDLFRDNERGWNKSLLRKIFPMQQVEAVLAFFIARHIICELPDESAGRISKWLGFVVDDVGDLGVPSRSICGNLR
ncbi:hypothetical protein ACFE04_010169 [Oxalis oulophora]